MMEATSNVSLIAAVLPGGADGLGAVAPALLVSLLLAAAVIVAGRRLWPLSFRRALLFFLLVALLNLGAAVLPPEIFAAARPLLLVVAQVLAWGGIIESLQGLIFDLFLGRWLRRPPVPRILRDFLTLILVLGVLFLALRGTLGVNLTSLLATSAMLSVVLGLALQDTLGSFFAGLALQMEAPLAIDDWVQIGEHPGRVAQVSWRTVRIVSLDGDEVTFPNSFVSHSTLVNFSRPTKRHRSFVVVRVHYRHSPHEVLATLNAAMRGVPGVLDDPAALALVWEFGESEIVYRARYWVEDFSRADLIRGEIAARLWYALRRAGIDHAFPARILKKAPPDPGPLTLGERAAGALRTVDLLGPLTEAERLLLAERLRPLIFGRGEIIIRQGERGDSLFVITRGRVEVRVASGGEDGVVSALGPGDFFGEMSLLTGDPRTATVSALEDTEVFPVTQEDFRRVAAANPAVLKEVTRIVSDRRSQLREAIRETEEAASARATAHLDLLERVCSFLRV